MRVLVTSGAEDQARRAEQELSFLPYVAAAVVELGAEELREHDSYTDRTGQLRANTLGRLVDRSGDSFTVELVMDTPYASYVRRLGFSDFYDVVSEVSRNIHDAIDAMNARISSDHGANLPRWATRQRGGTGLGR